MSAKMPPTVVFDIGNVLVRWDPRNLYRKMFDGDDAAMEAFLTNACSHEWLLELDAGSIAPNIASRVAAFPEYRDKIEAFDTRWLEALNGAIEENVSLFAQLKARGEKVYGITNYPADKFDLSRRHFPFYDWFDGVIVSGREGLVKPDPRIFALLLERYELRAADLLLIDDSPRNIAAAKAIGMDTVHFVLGVDLAAEFSHRGVLT